MSNPIQNFYKSTITQDWSIGTGNFYVSIKPTTSVGRLVVSPSSDTLREIVEYTSTGTDGNGDYIVISARGVGGTTEQTHTVGEKVRMNITAEDWEDMRDDIDNIVAAGAMDASTTVKGLVEEATNAEFIAGTDTGDTGARLFAVPSVIKANTAKQTDVQEFLTTGTWTKPTGAKSVFVQAWGAGGSGGRHLTQACGGGGGAYIERLFMASQCGATETVTVGTGGAVPAVNSVGNAGTNSSFGSLLVAYAGGGGGQGQGGGGGGGGQRSAGATGTTTVGGIGGDPLPGAGGSSSAGGTSIFGGGGGGDGATTGGESIYGGGGGSGYGQVGAKSVYGGGGGGGSDTSAISGGISIFGGNGGNGGDADPLATAGAVPGGGGGGGEADAVSGAGGNGKVIVTTFF